MSSAMETPTLGPHSCDQMSSGRDCQTLMELEVYVGDMGGSEHHNTKKLKK